MNTRRLVNHEFRLPQGTDSFSIAEEDLEVYGLDRKPPAADGVPADEARNAR